MACLRASGLSQCPVSLWLSGLCWQGMRWQVHWQGMPFVLVPSSRAKAGQRGNGFLFQKVSETRTPSFRVSPTMVGPWLIPEGASQAPGPQVIY